jgi:large subunit ribosomal protein L2
MSLKKYKPSTPGQRFRSGMSFDEVTGARSEKKLRRILKKSGGRSGGKVVVRHQAGRQKRFWREIDFKRNKVKVEARVAAIEYDPNRTVNIALLNYKDGEKRYILAPVGLKVGDKVLAGEGAQVKLGHAMPLSKVPVGTAVHNVELTSGRGGQIARSAGSQVILAAKEGNFAHLKMPSGEIRKVRVNCMATIGQLGNLDWKNVKFGKAGRKRHMGIKPTVRGVAQDPRSHPHGGGEGRSGIGMSSPKTPWGKKVFAKTRKKKRSDKLILKRRK